MTIELHPKVYEAVQAELTKLNQRLKDNPTTKEKALNTQPMTVDKAVNEVLWMTFRSGDISKHYTSQ